MKQSSTTEVPYNDKIDTLRKGFPTSKKYIELLVRDIANTPMNQYFACAPNLVHELNSLLNIAEDDDTFGNMPYHRAAAIIDLKLASEDYLGLDEAMDILSIPFVKVNERRTTPHGKNLT